MSDDSRGNGTSDDSRRGETTDNLRRDSTTASSSGDRASGSSRRDGVDGRVGPARTWSEAEETRSDGGNNVETGVGMAGNQPAIPTRLRVEWLAVVGCFVAVTLALAALARPRVGVETAVGWAGGTLAVGAFELWFLRARLRQNRRPDDPSANAEPCDPAAGPAARHRARRGRRGGPARTLGIANALTLVRGWLIAAVGGFALVEPAAAIAWLPAIAYGAGAGLDWVDGALARTVGRRTELGASLDLAFDTLGFLVAPVVAVLWGQLPVWYLSLSAARYLFRAGVAARRLRARPVYELPASVLRRPLAGLQMAFIALALSPLLSTGTAWTLAAIVLAPSLLVFLRDYLAVAGHLRTNRNREPVHAD